MQDLKTPTLRKYFLNKLGLEVSNYYKDIKSMVWGSITWYLVLSYKKRVKGEINSTIQQTTSDVEHYR